MSKEDADEARKAWGEFVALMADHDYFGDPEKFSDIEGKLTLHPRVMFRQLVYMVNMVQDSQDNAVRQETEAQKIRDEHLATLKDKQRLSATATKAFIELDILRKERKEISDRQVKGGAAIAEWGQSFVSTLADYMRARLRSKPETTNADIAGDVCNVADNSPALRWKHGGNWVEGKHPPKWNARTRRGTARARSTDYVERQIAELRPSVEAAIRNSVEGYGRGG